MAYEERFAMRQMQVIAGGWTDIQGLAILPIGCNYVIVQNNTASIVLFRSDPNNAASEFSIPANSSFQIGASSAPRGSVRFQQNCSAVGSLKLSAAGPITVLIESSD